MGVSPDDCSLVLRGLKTLDVRLKRLGESALTVAQWLRERGRGHCPAPSGLSRLPRA
jgi:cystathionine beta-lyase/cystathionine gamma-synthase